MVVDLGSSDINSFLALTQGEVGLAKWLVTIVIFTLKAAHLCVCGLVSWKRTGYKLS